MLNIDQLKYDFKKSKEEYFLNVIDGVSCVKDTKDNKIYWYKNESNKKDQWLFLEDIKRKRFWYDPTFETNISIEYKINSEEAKLFITEYIANNFNIIKYEINNQRQMFVTSLQDTLVEELQREIDKHILQSLRELK